MKWTNPNVVYLFAGAFIAMVAVYVGLTMLRTTYEGLSNSIDDTNAVIVEKTNNINKQTEDMLKGLTSGANSYIKLLTSYKNYKMALNIKSTVDKKVSAFNNISEYDQAIDYLKTLGVSDTVIDDPTIVSTINTNNTNTNSILTGLTADNQAYIDLLTSYKNLEMANGVLDASTNTTTPILQISEYDSVIDYLRRLAGIVVNNEPYVPTTRNITLSPSSVKNV